MCEVGAGQTERPFSLHAQEPSLPQSLSTFCTRRVSDNPKHDDVFGFRGPGTSGCHAYGGVFWIHVAGHLEFARLTCGSSRA